MIIGYIRSIILYIIVLIATRLMGKREIGELQPFEFVISLMIANLATIPMGEIGVPLFDGIVPIFGLLTVHLIISFFNLKSSKFRSIVCGKPRILINKGKIDKQALEQERFDLNELQEKLRQKEIFNIGDIDYAILETNGEISIMLKPEKRPITTGDLNIESEFNGLSYDLILDGEIMYENLRKLGKDYKWLKKQVEKFGVTPEKVLLATIDERGNFFCQKDETAS